MAGERSTVEVWIRARDLTAKVFGKFRRRLKNVAASVRSAARGLVTMTVAVGALLVGMTKLAQQGSKFLAVQRNFAKITDDQTQALESLRRATRGTVSDMQLMTSHNQALALGAAASTEEFAKMAEQARVLGRAQGIDAATALEKYTVGLARQSRLRLDDLGIVLSQTLAETNYRKELNLG